MFFVFLGFNSINLSEKNPVKYFLSHSLSLLTHFFNKNLFLQSERCQKNLIKKDKLLTKISLNFIINKIKMTDIKVGSLEEEALKRKERLKNLKRKAEPGESSQGGAINIPK
jgi:hypothetical protein